MAAKKQGNKANQKQEAAKAPSVKTAKKVESGKVFEGMSGEASTAHIKPGC